MQVRVSAFNVAYNGRSRILASKVWIHPPFDLSSPPDSQNAKEYIAIWDTGATNTVITEKVVRECGLAPIGVAQVNTASGVNTTNVYLSSVWLPNKVRFPQVRITEGKIAGNVDVLIGMDIIGVGDFAVTNKDGKTNFTFRIPSIECINFVNQKPPQIQSGLQKLRKIGRNEPCSCGSGKKYKKCCGFKQ